jgi:hypothetical protein
MNLTPLNNRNEFEQFLFSKIDLTLYIHKYLRSYIEKVLNGQKPLYDVSLINKTQLGWILILYGDILLVYGENWTVDQFNEISEIFDLNRFSNYTLAGETELIDKLINFYNPKNFTTLKRRLFYQTTKVHEYDNPQIEVKLGTMSNLGELAVMLQDYYHEEYNGLNDKKIAEMEERIFSLIQTEKVYALFDRFGILLSFCTIIDPDIGIMFTKKGHRNKGYCKIILSFCSNLLLRKNGIVYLMTDRDRVESNVVCEKIGFKPFFNYSQIEINSGEKITAE